MKLKLTPIVKTAEALELFDGVKLRLAKFLGVNHQAIDNFGEYLPPKRALQIYQLVPEKFEVDKEVI